ncbi:ABC transporter permease [Methylobacterium persicinum]|uniref:Peptide/nickel transport system permease protein n=1 Tax=Methylobacterium persicinum TaxID=374426 RepID=A0ABU0HIQ8_9HYPH|nr:ABC transporter permease [Methylobacterium persicinum]MDQ0442204.1 peptide/nickel transport system permease protein [Methylobacterium persicinum]GJE40322.1 Glutathione transport system permease protein GsiC [Methylobacterium persicinum]
MIGQVLRRLLTMSVTLLVISALIFFVIKLPPGDYLTNRIMELRATGEAGSVAKAELLIHQYGLDRPVWQQYLIWVGLMPGPAGFSGLLEGDWGWSFEYDKPVADVVGDALWLTLLVNVTALIFVHLVAIPAAIYSATHRHTVGDAVVTVLGYVGLAVPGFLLALIMLFYANRWFGLSIGGLYDSALTNQPWDGEKIRSLLAHLVVPTLVIGLGGTAAMIRRMRANLLDELAKPYTVTARAKGMPPTRALLKYPFRMSLNPFVADIGNLLPHLVSGSVLVSLVLSLPTVGPLLLEALRNQDQFMAGFILMFVAGLTLVGMLISDLTLVWLDPRIRMGLR